MFLNSFDFKESKIKLKNIKNNLIIKIVSIFIKELNNIRYTTYVEANNFSIDKKNILLEEYPRKDLIDYKYSMNIYINIIGGFIILILFSVFIAFIISKFFSKKIAKKGFGILFLLILSIFLYLILKN